MGTVVHLAGDWVHNSQDQRYLKQAQGVWEEETTCSDEAVNSISGANEEPDSDSLRSGQ